MDENDKVGLLSPVVLPYSQFSIIEVFLLWFLDLQDEVLI